MAAANSSKSDLALQSHDYEDCRVVTVTGRVDHTNSDAFSDDLNGLAGASPASGGMVVDLAGLEFITSAGLRALLLAQKAVTGSGGQLVVSGISGVVKEVFRISKFDALLAVQESTADAVAKVSAKAAESYPG